MFETIKVNGLSELLAQLRELADLTSDKTADQAVSASLRKAGVILQKAAQDNLRAGDHVKTGTLLENIIVAKTRKGLPPGSIAVIVTVRAKAKKFADNSRNRRSGRVGKEYKDYGPLFYARFLELGTSHQPRSAFMTPAFDQHAAQLPEVFRDDLAIRIENKKLSR